MFQYDELVRYADILIWGMQKARTYPYQTGDIIMLRYDFLGRELAEIVFEKLLDKGLHPIQRVNISPRMEHSFFSKANDSQLGFINPGEEEFMTELNGSISLLAPESLTHLQSIDPERIGTAIVSKKRLRDILEELENQGKFGWTLCLLPTPALAENAGLDIQEYTQQIAKACYLDDPSPIQRWEEIYHNANTIKDSLNAMDIESLHLISDHCDLIVRLGQERQWVAISGNNIPSFEIFTSPDWRGTQGVYFMDQPSFRNGNLVKNLRLEFKDGLVSDVKADKGQDFVIKQIALDQNANKLGEFSLTDKRFSRIDRFMAHTLYDENFGGEFGNSHIALGASYAESYRPGGKNLDEQNKNELGFNDSVLHWDLVNIEPKQVKAKLKSGQEQLIYENGFFLL